MHRIRHRSIAIRLIGVLALILVVAQRATGNIPSAFAYSCSNCGAIVDWYGSTYGGDTTISINHLNQGNGHTNTEIWLFGNPPSGQFCPINGVNQPRCWVETGIKAGLPQCSGSECYFWNDLRPCNCSGGNNYRTFFIATVPSGDYGGTLHTSIYTSSGTPGQFAVYTASPSVTQFNFSTGNNMLINDPSNVIQIGGEVQGTSGSTMPPTNFTRNYWLNSSSSWVFQTNGGNLAYNPPLYAYWATVPAPGNNGGNLVTYCNSLNYNC